MGLTINFERPPGTILTRRSFEPNELIRVAVKDTSALGAPMPSSDVTLLLEGYGFPPLYSEARTSLFGNVAFDVLMPDVNTKATLTIISTSALFGQRSVETIPISIGVSAPTPYPVTPPSGTDGTTPDFGGIEKWSVEKITKYALVGALGIGLLYLLSKSAPSVAHATRSIRSGR